MIDNLQKSGLKVLIQGLMEQTLGKAEWIALWCFVWKRKEPKLLFDGIVKNYNDAKQLVASQTNSNRFVRLYVSRSVVCGKETAGLPIHEGC
jgi:hypothetical protein